MARRPLSAIAVLVGPALLAAAQPAAPMLEASRQRIAKAFGQGADVSGVDLRAARELKQALGCETRPSPACRPVLRLLALHAQAKSVQLGRASGETPSAYRDTLLSVADGLDLDHPSAECLYGGRLRGQAAASQGPRSCAANAAARSDPRMNSAARPGQIRAPAQQRARNELMRTSSLLLQTRNDGLFRSLRDDPFWRASARQAGAGTDVLAQLPPIRPIPAHAARTNAPAGAGGGANPRLGNSPAPSPAPAVASLGFLADSIDWARGRRIAAAANELARRAGAQLAGLCYRAVKWVWIQTGELNVSRPEQSGLVGLRAARAKYFTEDVRRNPELLAEMGYRQVDPHRFGNNPAAVPDGTILNYAAGCAFAHPRAGHIELVASHPNAAPRPDDPDDVRVCHNDCTHRTLRFMRTYGSDHPGRRHCLNVYVPVKKA